MIFRLVHKTLHLINQSNKICLQNGLIALIKWKKILGRFNRKVRPISLYLYIGHINVIFMYYLTVRELGALHTKRLMVNFESDETQQEREIEAKTHEITEVFHHAEKVLKRCGREEGAQEHANVAGQEAAGSQHVLQKHTKGTSNRFHSLQLSIIQLICLCLLLRTI